MVDSEYRQQYEPRYIGSRFDGTAADESGTPILLDNLGVEGQITTLRVYADEEVSLDIKVSSIDTGEDPIPLDGTVSTTGSETRIFLDGQKSYTIGDFENPELEIGAYNQFQVVLQTDVSDTSSVSVNARVDERRG